MQNSDNKEILVDTDGVQLHRGKTPRTKEFTYKFMISCDGAPEVPLESLSPEERTQAAAVMTKRLGDTLSDYYTRHPDEFAALDV